MESGSTNEIEHPEDLKPFYAYKAEMAGVETVMRMSAVKRWHMIDTTRQQTLAEHSANVALLAYYVAIHAPEMFFGGASWIAAAALCHDIEEVFSGDIPTPTKRYGNAIRPAMKDLEERLVPTEFRFNPDPAQKLLIKICDLADGIRFIRLHGVDVTSQHAKTGLERQLKKCYDQMEDWPPEVRRHVSVHAQFYAYEFS